MADKKKTPAIYDVAQYSGISISTSSRVLNNPEKVNAQTRARALSRTNHYRYHDAVLYNALRSTSICL